MDDTMGLSAQLAYFFLLSMFPMMIFVVTLLPYLPFTEAQFMHVVELFVPNDAANFVQKILLEVISRPSKGLLSIGVITAIWSMSNGVNAVVEGLNRAYDVKENRSWIRQRALSILLTFAMMFVLVLSLALPVFGKQIEQLILRFIDETPAFRVFWRYLRWGFTETVLIIAFTIFYWVGPNIKFKCRKAIPGALFASVGWIFSSLGFAYFVDNFGNFSTAYGSLGGILFLILWFYITGFFIILGGQLNAVLTEEERGCGSD